MLPLFKDGSLLFCLIIASSIVAFVVDSAPIIPIPENNDFAKLPGFSYTSQCTDTTDNDITTHGDGHFQRFSNNVTLCRVIGRNREQKRHFCYQKWRVSKLIESDRFATDLHLTADLQNTHKRVVYTFKCDDIPDTDVDEASEGGLFLFHENSTQKTMLHDEIVQANHRVTEKFVSIVKVFDNFNDLSIEIAGVMKDENADSDSELLISVTKSLSYVELEVVIPRYICSQLNRTYDEEERQCGKCKENYKSSNERCVISGEVDALFTFNVPCVGLTSGEDICLKFSRRPETPDEIKDFLSWFTLTNYTDANVTMF